jgi:hypothetical protein
MAPACLHSHGDVIVPVLLGMRMVCVCGAVVLLSCALSVVCCVCVAVASRAPSTKLGPSAGQVKHGQG